MWTNTWSDLENIPCVCEKKMCTFGWNSLYIFVKSIWSNVSFKTSVPTFKTSVSLLIYFPDVSIDKVRVLKAPTFTVLSVSHIMSANICFKWLHVPLLGTNILKKIVVSSMPWLLCNVHLVSHYNLCFKAYFDSYK